MLHEFLTFWKKESLCDDAFQACMKMLRESQSMFNDAIKSLRNEEELECDIFDRDRAINKFERLVRRDVVTHLAVSNNPDINNALVLTAISIDIERVGDYTKNIVELALIHPGVFQGGDIEKEILEAESTIQGMFAILPDCIEDSDMDKAREIMGDHQVVADNIEDCLRALIDGKVITNDTGQAAAATLYLRYLKRISAHLKNVATSVVNPYYRIGFREKDAPRNGTDSGK